MACKSTVINNNALYIKLETSILSEDLVADAILSRSLDTLFWKTLKTTAEFIKENNESLSILHEKKNSFLMRIELILDPDVVSESKSLTDFMKKMDLLLSNDAEEIQREITNAFSIKNQEETESVSSFLIDTIGTGFESSNFQKEVKSKLFNLTVWDRKNNKFILSPTEIKENINTYISNLETKLKTNIKEDLKIAFRRAVDSVSLIEDFEKKAIISGIAFEDFKDLFEYNYLDNFIQLNFPFIKIDLNLLNNFNDLSDKKYSYNTGSNLTFIDDEEFADLETNTEAMIRVFIENFDLYDYTSSQKTNLKFTVNTFLEAISWIKSFGKVYTEPLNFKNGNKDTSIIDYLIKLNLHTDTISKEDTSAEAEVLRDLKLHEATRSTSYLIELLNEQPDFYIKYFLQVLMKDNDSLNPEKLAGLKTNKNLTTLSTKLTDTKLNYIFSLYLNLYALNGEDKSLLETDSLYQNYNLHSPKYYSNLSEHIQSAGNIEVIEIKNNDQDGLEQQDLKNSSFYEERRQLEEDINNNNIFNNPNRNPEDFLQWLDSLLVPNIEMNFHLNDAGEQEFLYSKDFGKGHLWKNFSMSFNGDQILFCENKSGHVFDLPKLKENKNFQEFVSTILSIPYDSDPVFQKSINADTDKFKDLLSLCFDVIAANYARRENKTDLIKDLKFGKIFNSNDLASVQSDRSAELQSIADAKVIASGNEKLNIYNDASKNPVSSSTYGNLGSRPYYYYSEAEALKNAPIRNLSLYKEGSNLEIKTLRDIKLDGSLGLLWKNTSKADMFTYVFLTEFIGGFTNEKSNSLSTTNGTRIGAPAVVNADKTAFYQAFISSTAKIFNGKSLAGEKLIENDKTVIENLASTKDIQIQMREDLKNFYHRVALNIHDQYLKDCKKLGQTPFNELPSINNITAWHSLIVKFYSQKEAIKEYNLSEERTEDPIEVNNVYHVKNERFITEYIKLMDYKSSWYDYSSQVGNILFLHELLKNNTLIPQINTSDKDRIFSTLKNLLEGNAFALNLYENIPEDKLSEYAEVKLPESFKNSFYDISKTYYIKTPAYLKDFQTSENLEDSESTQEANKIQITKDGKSYYMSISSFMDKECKHSDVYMPLAKVSYVNKDGITCHETLTGKSDFKEFTKRLAKSKGGAAYNLKSNPFAFLDSSLGIEITLNPILEKYNAFATYIQHEYILGQDGSNFAHSPKGAPSRETFFKKNPWLENTELGEIAYHDVVVGFGDKTQQKRNNNNTALMKLPNTSIISGIPPKIKVACVADIKELGYSPNGSTGTIKGLDGSTIITGTAARALNLSLGAAKVGQNTLKLFATLYDQTYGLGSNNKTANFTITNEKMRQDEFYLKMYFNMTRHMWRKKDNSKFTPKNVFISDLTKTPLLSTDIPFFYKTDGKYYMRTYKGLIDGKYVFTDIECNEKANPIGQESEPIKYEFQDNFELFMALGGWNSCSLKNNKLQYSEWSLDKLFEIQYSITENGNSSKYKINAFLPLLNSDIYMLFTEGAIKMTHINKEDTHVLTDSIYDENGNFKKKSNYNFYYQSTKSLGPQLDKEHHADNSHIANMTLVMSACISLGYTRKEALSVYKSLKALSRINTKKFRNDESFLILASDSDIENVLFSTICDYLILNKDTESESTLGILTKKFIKRFLKNRTILSHELEELTNSIPLDNTVIFKKVSSIIGSTLTKAGIKLKVSGNLAVINPAAEIVKYYVIPKNLPLNFSEEWVKTFHSLIDTYKDFSPIRIYNFLVNNFENFKNIKEEEIKNLIAASDSTFKKRLVRFERIPGIKFEGLVISNKHVFIKDILTKLAEPITSDNQINIGGNYSFTIEGELAVTEFLNSLNDKEKKSLQLSSISDFSKITFWANINLPHLSIDTSKNNAIGAHLVKSWRSKFGDALSIKKIYNLGHGFEFSQVSFKDQSGDDFELTDLYSTLLYFKLNPYKKAKSISDIQKKFKMYSTFLSLNDKEFEDYFLYYFHNKLNYTRQETLTEAQQVKNKVINDIIAAVNASSFLKPEELSDTLRNIFSRTFDQEKIEKRLEGIHQIIADVCDSFLYKKHLDDLHALSKESEVSEQYTQCYVIDGYNGDIPKIKQVKIDKSSIKSKVCGLIMPKTMKTVLGLSNPEDTINDILENPLYFTTKLIKENLCKLKNPAFYDPDINEEEELTVNLWDLCFKSILKNHIYVKRNSALLNKYLQANSQQFSLISTIFTDSEGVHWAKDLTTNKVICKLFSDKDKIYKNNITGDLLIVTQDATITDSEGNPVVLKDSNKNNFDSEKYTISNNPLKFYTENLIYNTFAVNTEEASNESFEKTSLMHALIDNALVGSKFDSLWRGLSSEWDTKIELLESLQNALSLEEIKINGVKSLYLRQGKLMHQSFNKILNVIAARIPAQCLQSVMPMKVSDFIESDENNALVSPYQFYLLGSDLDIDSVSILTFTLNDSGIFQAHSPYYDLELDEASAALPFKPELKEVNFDNSSSISMRNIIAKYGEVFNTGSYTEKSSFYSFLTSKGETSEANKLCNEMFEIQRMMQEKLNEQNSNGSKSLDVEIDDDTYTVYKSIDKKFTDKSNYIGALTLATQYWKNHRTKENLDKLKLLRKYLREYFNRNNENKVKCLTIINDQVYLEIDTEEQMRAFAELLDLFDEENNTVNGNIKDPIHKLILRFINNHYQYYHKLSKKNQEIASENNELNNLYKVTIDTSHMSESFVSIDNLTGPVKDLADEQELSQEGWYSTVTNCTNIHSGVSINMAGKDGIAICAVAEKHYFALMGAFLAVMQSDDEVLKRCLIAGLPWTTSSGEQIKNKVFNGKIANKYCHILSNAFDSRLIQKDFLFGETFLHFALTEEEQQNIDSLLQKLVEEQRYNTNAALIISALLSLATDNAKELVLGKINASVGMIDLFLAGATVGFSINELISIVNSSYGKQVADMLNINHFTGKSASQSALRATLDFENIAYYIAEQFKHKTVYVNNFIDSKHLPQAVILKYIGHMLFKDYCKNLKQTDPKNFESSHKEEFNILQHFENTEIALTDAAKKVLKEWEFDPILAYKKYHIPELKNTSWEILENNKKVIETIKSEAKLYGINIYDLENLEENLTELKNKSTVLTLDVSTLKDYLINKKYSIPYEDRMKLVYLEILQQVNFIKTNKLFKLYAGLENKYALFDKDENPKEPFTNIFNDNYADERLNFLSPYNKLKLVTEQVWQMWFDRLGACIDKYTNTLAGDYFHGTYKTYEAVNILAQIAQEFSLGSKLLINKELKTDPEEAEKMITNFEDHFVNQLRIHSSNSVFEESKYYPWISNIKDSNSDFLANYIEFDEQGLPSEGAKLNIRNFLYDPEYRKNCLLLMNELKVFHNTLVAIAVLPLYLAYIESLLAQQMCQNSFLQTYVKKYFTNPLIKKWKVKNKAIRTQITKKTGALMELININSFLRDKDFKIKYNNGKEDVEFNLNSEDGQMLFVEMVESEINNLKRNSKFSSNLFVKKLTRRPVKYTLHGHTILPYSVGINLNPSSKDTRSKSILNEVLLDYLALNSFGTNNLKDNHSITYKVKNDKDYDKFFNFADLFYLYSLLTTGNQVSKTSLSRLVNTQLKIENSIATEYYAFQAKLNRDILKDIKSNINSKGNFKLNNAKKFLSYLFLLEDNKELISPIISREDAEAGSFVRILDLDDLIKIGKIPEKVTYNISEEDGLDEDIDNPYEDPVEDFNDDPDLVRRAPRKRSDSFKLSRTIYVSEKSNAPFTKLLSGPSISYEFHADQFNQEAVVKLMNPSDPTGSLSIVLKNYNIDDEFVKQLNASKIHYKYNSVKKEFTCEEIPNIIYDKDNQIDNRLIYRNLYSILSGNILNSSLKRVLTSFLGKSNLTGNLFLTKDFIELNPEDITEVNLEGNNCL